MKTTKYLIISATLLLAPVAAQATPYDDFVRSAGNTSSSTQTVSREQLSIDDMYHNDNFSQYGHDHMHHSDTGMNHNDTTN